MATSKVQATQEFVPLKEIRNSIAILKDGGMRAMLLVSSVNIALKSDDERAAILGQFQNFLNSLDFSVQIFIESRRFDISPYLALLTEQEKKQTSELMKIQMTEYVEFIRTFAESHNIMKKRFIIVIPYSSPAIQPAKSFFGLFGKKKAPVSKDVAHEAAFEEYLSQLEQRVSVVEQGLTASGLRTVRLGNEEMLELYHSLFNPGETGKPMPIA